ncbi:hypothetical protein COH20_011943 [Aspergillus flavus]|nr:hypothetical protein COH20_011943 [Aspergillus flavus]RAQ81660.1 hypothetical protein COH21_009218 [Aspergillus flavus]
MRDRQQVLVEYRSVYYYYFCKLKTNIECFPPFHPILYTYTYIVLVQGSFQTPLVYNELLTHLRDLGHPVVLPPLPSCSDVEHYDFPTRTLADDALAITKVVEQLVEDGKTVVLVMHSYGGIVGSEAIPENLSYRARQAGGQKGGVIHLFYYTAFVLDK